MINHYHTSATLLVIVLTMMMMMITVLHRAQAFRLGNGKLGYASRCTSRYTRLHGGSLREFTEEARGSAHSSLSAGLDPMVALQTALPTNANSPNLLRLRHTSAHVMAMAVQRLYPKVKVTIGPWIENGFYYDFSVPPTAQLSVGDLKKIKKEMDKIIRRNLPINRLETSREEARRRIMALDEPYKLEILDDINSDNVTWYSIGEEWWDLCAGPHVQSTGDLHPGSIELEAVAGAYWRGNEKNEMLQRIYGTAWETPEQLALYKLKLEESRRRDHRLLGKQLDLFSIQEEAGGGLVFWHPHGTRVRRIIEKYWEDEHFKRGYELVRTPHIASVELWRTSGHLDYYSADMFRPITVPQRGDKEATESEAGGEPHAPELLQLKPMNCPFHCLMYKDRARSYRDLPIRWAELGTVYRHERSGALHGLFRVRGFTQDDAHIFCLPEQLEGEIVGILSLTQEILNKFGFHTFDVKLSTQPKDSVGSASIWQRSTLALEQALHRKGWEYSVDEGGGAFYGPKIDINIQDALGRQWQCSTIQCDFNLPERFALEYTGSDGQRQRPILVHRAVLGSLERFFGVLLENTAGDFPLWLAPVQLRLLPVVDQTRDYCLRLKEQAEELGLRVEVDSSGERIAKQIRNAELDKVTFACIVGERERAAGTLSVRQRGNKDRGCINASHFLETLSIAARNCSEPTNF